MHSPRGYLQIRRILMVQSSILEIRAPGTVPRCIISIRWHTSPAPVAQECDKTIVTQHAVQGCNVPSGQSEAPLRIIVCTSHKAATH
jgi:hypothetical protein